MTTSVLISNYNYGQFLGAAIESVLGQSKAAHEIIVVDDGSTDHSKEIIESFGDKIISIFQENSGQAAAISQAYERASGDIIMLMDADDIFHPHKIEILESLYEGSPDINWIFHDLKEVAQDKIHLQSTSISKDIAPKSVDQRKEMTRGKLRYDAPATSGLSFRRDFMKDFFPMPQADGINLSDHYIKFYCIASARGYHLSEPLGLLVLHGGNLYSGGAQSTKAKGTRARIFATTAICLKHIAPQTAKFCHTLMSEALLCAKKADIYDEMRGLIGQYMSGVSVWTRLKIALKVFVKILLKR